ncbi:MAG: SDR family NAD(P)-dependent oxidoreductase [Solirubrobacteraceae bacterium]
MAPTVKNEVVEALRASLKDVERLKQQNERLLEERHQPIAIVGIGCRYPGGVCSKEDLWELVAGGTDAVSFLPSDRGWDLEGLYDPDPDHPGTSYAREGGFLDGAVDFDAAFFGIGPREALAMDPQQRLLLEVCWEALEDAGVDPHLLKGSQTGVFAGITNQDYLIVGQDTSEGLEGHLVTGVAGSVISGRVAYTLGLEGPAVTIDTACSSSLVALHLACQALRASECSLALAGGLTVLSTPSIFVGFSRQRGLSPDGRCKSFADGADGTGWSEGAGVLLLERLSDAQRNGHDVLAVIRGSAVNQDGASNGLTAPNGPSQQRVIRQALANARLSANQIDAVEAHGTGTVLGDPIEAQALIATYGYERDLSRPLWLGSVKSNIGHTQGAAGVAGVIKMVMALQGERLPKTLHVDEPTTQVDWSTGTVTLLTEEVRWQFEDKPRRAGVSAFGVSGTNVHMILEEAPPVERMQVSSGTSLAALDGASEGPAPAGVSIPWVLSGKGSEALRDQARRLLAHVQKNPDLSVADVGCSLARHAAFESRAVFSGGERDDMLDGLRGFLDDSPLASVAHGMAHRDAGGIVAMFAGQGSQRVGMGRGLYDAFPLFKDTFDEVCEHLDPRLGRSLGEVVFGGAHSAQEASERTAGESGLLDRTVFAQTGLFALEVALFRLVEACGVRADYVMGHSVGELAAVHVAGVLSLEDACALVAARGQLMEALPTGGAMVSIQASEQEVLHELGEPELWEEQVALGAVNGPMSVVLSGDEDVVLEIAAGWERRGRSTRRLRVSHAFHSPRMDGMLEEFAEVASGLSFSHPEIPVVSNVTGEVLSGERIRDPRYWVDQVRRTVRFANGVGWLRDRGARRFLEIGPGSVLAAMCHECLAQGGSEEESDRVSPDLAEMEGQAEDRMDDEESVGVRPFVTVATLRRDHFEPGSLLNAFAEIWVDGGSLDWGALFDPSRARRVPLPSYAFQRERYWIESSGGVPRRLSSAGSSPLPPLLTSASKQTVATADGSLASRLARIAEDEREKFLLELIRTHAAVVLGHSSIRAIPVQSTFKEIGFDSLAAVQLRDRLSAAAGMTLPATLTFDNPTPLELARYVLERLTNSGLERRVMLTHRAPSHEPIAIVGMSCRYPGGVGSAEDLWELVSSGGDAISSFPADRGWDLDALNDPDPDRSGASWAQGGGFLPDAGDFDAELFGISPREVLAMDPQQRLLLEVCWEAFEAAGIDPTALRGSPTGVFVGLSASTYGIGPAELDQTLAGYRLTGSVTSVASGRIAYTFGLEGPAVSLDTACSSSLVALHLACQALREDECSLALAGGAIVMASPGLFVEFSRQRGLARNGRCKSFSNSADGTSWSEGAGVLVLERLSDALRRGHRVAAIVSGSAVNQDGASNGLTAPNGPSQERVIHQALANAGLSPQEVDAVEAHGTGTALGDPIEAQALLATYGQQREASRPLWLGSIKSNIGHTSGAAGVAGVIKMAMALERGVLPKTLHVDEPTRQVDWSAGNVSLLTEPVPWPENERPRRAGISSFGISGTNAHVIIEEHVEAPTAIDRPADDVMGHGCVPWVLSAHTTDALRGQGERLRAFAAGEETLGAADVGISLASRPVLGHRAVALGRDRDELFAALDGKAPMIASSDGKADPGERGRVVFAFPGQGSQWVGMGVELLSGSELFAKLIGECGDALAELVEWRLEAVLRGEPGAPALDRVDVVQPVLFAVMVALAGWWRACGVRPDAVVGHSQGEIAAAHVAGALSLKDAARVVVARSRALVALAGRGGMVSIAASVSDVESLIEGYGPDISLAAVNGPRSVVVSGEEDALDQLLRECEQQGQVKARRIAVDYAAHSVQIDALREELVEACGSVTAQTAKIPFYSSVTGARLDGSELNGDYWYRNLRETVDFQQATRALLDDGFGVFVEVSPAPVLAVGVTETAESPVGGGRGVGSDSEDGSSELADICTFSSLRRGDGGPRRLMRSLAEAWVAGVDVDWGAVFEGSGARPVRLPTYAFQRERYWLESTVDIGGSSGDAGSLEGGFWDAVEAEDLSELASTLGLEENGERSSLESVLPALSTWRRRRRKESLTDGWRYRLAWKRASATRTGLSGNWIVVVPAGYAEDPWVVSVLDAMRMHGAQACQLDVEEHMMSDRSLLAELLRGALVDGDGVCVAASEQESSPPPTLSVEGVLSLLALREDPHPLYGAVPLGLAGTLALVQALEQIELSAPLWLATRGAVSVERSEELRNPTQGMVWGLGPVAGLEFPQRGGGLLDLPETLDSGSRRSLSAALAGVGEEDRLAVRSTGLFVRRLLAAPAGGSSAPEIWKPRGTVLITGGVGGLGANVARWLARAGAPRLVLVSRRGPASEGAASLKSELEGLGAEVSVVACDVSDRDQLVELFASLPSGHPLDAIVHAAGVPGGGPLEGMGVDGLQQTLACKAQAALHLHELTEHMDLSAFVMFSSVAASMGSGGQGDYAAANAYLDALAEHRRSHGLPATSVAWGLWAGAGMADVAGIEGLHRRGIMPMEPEQAIGALAQALDRRETSLVVTRMDWDRYAPSYTFARARPLIEDLPPVREALEEASGRSGDDPTDGELLQSRLVGLSERERERAVLDLVRAETADVLAQPEADAISPERAFRDVGFDSLMAVELRKRLQAKTGLQLATTVAFDYPTPILLAEYLLREAAGAPRSELEARPSGARTEEPIAIVAMSCRYPGGASSPESLWQLVRSGIDAISPFPTDRGWDLEALYDPDPDRTGTSYTREGGFVHDFCEFDASFFGISPREALAMDPQQRILLEVCWEAIERAGIDPLSLRGSDTGIFAGINPSAYGLRLPSELEGYRVTGSAGSVVSGRVAYTLGLEGPAVSIDTACSSSLVALHLACAALRAGESDMVLAGGVAVTSTPDGFIAFSRQRGLAADGRCKSFADGADGTGWSEGVGMLLLERLSDAQRSGHPILALVRGSAINQDGASNGLTAPNGLAQQRVIRQALANANLSGDQVQAVEGHGTGTTLGDPIEAQALLATYGRERRGEDPLWLGSIKSNISHPQAAAGVAGVIKMVMALQHRTLPKTLHVEEPSRQVDWSGGSVALLREEVAWESEDEPRRAGVSSFGASGTNAHMILEEAPDAIDVDAPRLDADGAPRLAIDVDAPRLDADDATRLDADIDAIPWILSGKGTTALCEQAARLSERVESDPHVSTVDVGFSLAVSRSSLDTRAVVLGEDRQSLLSGLRSLAQGEPDPIVVEGSVADVDTALAFLFTGQGAQRIGMGRELYTRFPVFREALEEVCRHLDELLECSLLEVVFGERESSADDRDAPDGGERHEEDRAESAEEGVTGGASLDDTVFTQTGLFALEVALFRLLEDFGLHPDYLLGHSIGELSAAHVAGVLELEQACVLVAARGRLMAALPRGGAMLAIQASEREARESLVGLEQLVSLAAINGPQTVVLSGEQDAVLELEGLWGARGRKTKRLRVSHAFHSPQMEAMLDEYREVVAGLTLAAPRIPIVSNLTGAQVSAEQICDPEYWVRQVREPVRFYDGVSWLAGRDVSHFLELGPDGVLSAMAQDCLAEGANGTRGADEEGGPVARTVSALRGSRPEAHALLAALAELWVHGIPVNWGKAFDDLGARRVHLPTYAFQRQRHWLDGHDPAFGDLSSSARNASRHPILDGSLPLADGRGWLFTGRLGTDSQPWLNDHVVFGEVLVPGTTFVDLALSIAEEVGCDLLQELVMEVPLLLSKGEQMRLQVSVAEADDAGRRAIELYSAPRELPGGATQSPDEWTRHASGTLALADRTATGTNGDGSHATVLAGTWPPAGAEPVSIEPLYEHMAALGIEYGPALLGVRAIWRRGEELFTEVRLPEHERDRAGRFHIHPALLDAALQGSMVHAQSLEQLPIPFAWNGVSVQGAGAPSLRVHILPTSSGGISLTLVDESGAPVASVASLVSRIVTAEQLGRASERRRTPLLSVDWVTVTGEREPSSLRGALIGDATARLMARVLDDHVSLDSYEDLPSLREAVRSGAPVPEIVVFACIDNHAGQDKLGSLSLDQVSNCTHVALELTQEWLADSSLADSQLIFVTRNAVAVRPGESVDGLAQSTVWGLVRSAQTENPRRLLLVDLDEDQSSWDLLSRTLGSVSMLDEPQLAIRQGSLLTPRIKPIEREEVAAADSTPAGKRVGAIAPAPFDPRGTVLLTGGTGGLGKLVARHLVAHYEVRHLLLTSRRGADAEGAAELAGEIESMGAQVSIVACDVAKRDQVEALLSNVAEEHPLCAVIHLAGILDDGVVGALTPERVDSVLAPKVSGAWHLHSLTEHLDLSAFVLFSSVAGVLGGMGQANYAAANAFLDALAAYRRARGRAAVSLAWGPWETPGGMAQQLGEIDSARMTRAGLNSLSDSESLELFDLAHRRSEPLLVALSLNRSALASQAQAGPLPSMLRGMARAGTRRAGRAEQGALARRLAGAPAHEHEHILLQAVRSHVAGALGFTSAEAIDAAQAFKDLGFDSLAAIELRNRLNEATGMSLPATLIFDHPTPGALAVYLLERVAPDGERAAAVAFDAELDSLERLLATAVSQGSDRPKIRARLQAIMDGLGDSGESEKTTTLAEDMRAATADEVIDFIKRELGPK